MRYECLTLRRFMLMEFELLNDSHPPEPKKLCRENLRLPTEVGQSGGRIVDTSQPTSDRGGPQFSGRRWLLIGLGLTLIGVVGAVASVALRRTRLAKTTQFWGPDVVRALQSSEQFRLTIPPDSPLEWKTESIDGSVELSDTPGIAHLRHALLDERHYHWDTSRREGIESVIAEISNAEWVTIELHGTPSIMQDDPPTESVVLTLELSRGWVGIAGGNRAVQMRERVRSAVRHNLLMFSNVTTRADVK